MNSGEPMATMKIAQIERAAALFHSGESSEAELLLGAGSCGDRFVFRVWAPRADAVSVVGDFNGWRADALPMQCMTPGGIWEAFLPLDAVREGERYKYCIRRGDRAFLKADPYAYRMQPAPDTASEICTLPSYGWRDAGWMSYRNAHFDRARVARQPISVYQLHRAAWRRHEDGTALTLAELADELSVYTKQMGYTHISLLAMCEQAADATVGGARCTGYYATGARYGTPEEMMRFVDRMHEAGIGVLVDLCMGGFADAAYALTAFDGDRLYECGGTQAPHVCGFDLSRGEVQSFLLSNARFWARRYHIDGFTVRGVKEVLLSGGAAFLRRFNRALEECCPDLVTVADGTDGDRCVTGFDGDGLGFSLCGDGAWVRDALAYAREDPVHRRYHHALLGREVTNGAALLPLEAAELTDGKRAMLDRMAGGYAQRFAGARATLAYLCTMPAKNLHWMGCEIGMFSECRSDGSVEWHLLAYDMHRRLQLFTAELNHFYLSHGALYERDGEADGFAWIDRAHVEEGVLSYRRVARDGSELVIVLNLMPERRDGFLLPVPAAGEYREIFNTDGERYGGTGAGNPEPIRSVPHAHGAYRSAIACTLPPMSAVVFACEKRTRRRK